MVLGIIKNIHSNLYNNSGRAFVIISHSIVISFAIIFALKIFQLSNGDVLNSYPFITPDGFDWYLEGVYLVKLINGYELPALHILRPPVFVFVTALDFALGHRGLVLAFSSFFAISITYFSSVYLVNAIQKFSLPKSYLLPIVVGVTLYPLNYVRVYLLSDSLAVAFSLLSVATFVRAVATERNLYFYLSSVIALVAGLTQTYAILPYVVAVLFFCISKQVRIDRVRLIAIFTVLIFLFFSITSLWRYVVPHMNTPENFTLLKLSGAMFFFYFNTWGYFFFPLLFFIFLTKKLRFSFSQLSRIGFLFLINVIIFSLLCFFYQWPESRFTFYFWSWALLLSVVSLRPIRPQTFLCYGSFLFLWCLFVVPNYWAPIITNVTPEVSKSWFIDFAKASPIDRNIQISKNLILDNVIFYENSDVYTKNSISLYAKIIQITDP